MTSPRPGQAPTKTRGRRGASAVPAAGSGCLPKSQECFVPVTLCRHLVGTAQPPGEHTQHLEGLPCLVPQWRRGLVAGELGFDSGLQPFHFNTSGWSPYVSEP